jgi:hypothetical protein
LKLKGETLIMSRTMSLSTSTARADALIPAAHPFRRHLHRVARADAAGAHRPWTPADGPLPALYISHGAPPLFEDTPWMAQLADKLLPSLTTAG